MTVRVRVKRPRVGGGPEFDIFGEVNEPSSCSTERCACGECVDGSIRVDRPLRKDTPTKTGAPRWPRPRKAFEPVFLFAAAVVSYTYDDARQQGEERSFADDAD
eukprot:3065861-Prymnesium_polylepis.1